MDAIQGGSWLYLYMPIAGINIFWPGLVLIGFSVGIIGGFFGMGGAWMVTPGLNILGFLWPLQSARTWLTLPGNP
jgi:uncharacterized membrane protein YfcA